MRRHCNTTEMEGREERIVMKDFLLSHIKMLWKVMHPSTNKWLPPRIHPDDVFVVSYPKSGNTWVRFLIANLIKRGDEEVDFHSLSRYVPEVGRHNRIIHSMKPPRVMKSHAPYVSRYPRVIYVVRDGRDVYVSYYFHRLRELPAGTTFKDFLINYSHFPCLWGEHVLSWLHRGPQTSEMLVVKYENLLSDCCRELKRIADFIGLEVESKQLQDAVEAASFENMRHLELARGRPYQSEGPEIFTRKGKSGEWREFFGPEEKALFKEREGEALLILGYEKDEEW